MGLVNIIKTGADGYRKISISASAFTFHGANSKALLALPSLMQKLGGHKVGSGEMNSGKVLALIGASVSGLLGCKTVAYCDEAEHESACPCYPWPSKNVLGSYDPTLISSGGRSYRHDCSSCHTSLNLIVKPSNESATKNVVTEIEVADDRKDKREMYTNSAKLRDQYSLAYTNKYGLKFVNGGAYSPDITKIIERMRFNPYFSSGAISIHKVHNNCTVECTMPASVSQMGKDLVKSSA